MKKRSLTVASFVMVLVVVVLVASVPPARAQFVLADWEYPDEYGQGIKFFKVFENSTGSWVQVGDVYSYDQTIIIEWNVSLGIKLRAYTLFNSTLTGASDSDDGKNFQQHSVIVIDNIGTTVFSKQNFTYYDVDVLLHLPLWCYCYDVVLNFLPLEGQYYTVTVGYQTFWG